jgi:hypothetical protein
MENCIHHIREDHACPWCGRESLREQKLSKPKRPYHFYQETFGRFLNFIADESAGPMAITIIATDGNGQTYNLVEGDVEMIKEHINILRQRIREAEGASHA